MDNALHIHIVGICGTFMGSLAQLSIAKGYRVTGCDAQVYPPMSTQLEKAGIELIEGFSAQQLELKPDVWVIGNAVSRGNELVEAILNSNGNYVSGPYFLRQHILKDKWVMAVAGTHGKTSTASMLAWVLSYAGFDPSYLIGGVPTNFEHSARLGKSDFFVIEADEYDTAFFDKHSKFLHYQPRTLILNNLEFDHADIFKDLAAIQTEFHHLLRTVPAQGQIVCNAHEPNLQQIIDQGCWTPVEQFALTTQAADEKIDAAEWQINGANQVFFNDPNNWTESAEQGVLNWSQLGEHNKLNALAVIAAARSIGIAPQVSIEALGQFKGVKRRMELLQKSDSYTLYDDFAHHPTAIQSTLSGLKKATSAHEKIIAVIELRSNTMKMGIHADTLVNSVDQADEVYWFTPPNMGWNMQQQVDLKPNQTIYVNIDQLQAKLVEQITNKNMDSNVDMTHVVIMSNGGFHGLHQNLLKKLLT